MMNRVIATINASSTHNVMAWSTQEPSGGFPGKMLRNGTTANSMAANQETNGGRNFFLPNAIGIATHSAKAGKAIRTSTMPRSKISVLFDRCKVMITSSGRDEFSVVD